MSFAWHCIGSIVGLDHSAFFFKGNECDRFNSGVYDNNDFSYVCDFVPSLLHASYKKVFTLPPPIVYARPYEVCLSIEDHFKNDLLLEKIAVKCEIDEYESSIESAKTLIADSEFKIDELKAHLAKYEVDLYASRVESDILN